MEKSKNIINYWLYANKLKNKIRTGWVEFKISKPRLESVAEHVFSCLQLAIALDSEYDLDLDMFKVLKMLTLHETEEMIMKDYTLRDRITKEEKDKLGMECVLKITNGLRKKDEIISIINEFNERKTKEAIFCYHIDKIDADMQAKLYDLEGVFDIEESKKDLEYYGDRKDEIASKSNTASDYMIESDRPKYDDDEIFKDLLNEIQGWNYEKDNI